MTSRRAQTSASPTLMAAITPILIFAFAPRGQRLCARQIRHDREYFATRRQPGGLSAARRRAARCHVTFFGRPGVLISGEESVSTPPDNIIIYSWPHFISRAHAPPYVYAPTPRRCLKLCSHADDDDDDGRRCFLRRLRRAPGAPTIVAPPRARATTSAQAI